MQIKSINIATAHPLLTANGKVFSAIGKKTIDQIDVEQVGQFVRGRDLPLQNGGRGSRCIALSKLGLVGDEQVDQTVHGGLDKAVYAYPLEHYAFWQDRREQYGLHEALTYGAMGENLSITGLLETDVYKGDRLIFADCVLEVTTPRQPCYKFNTVLGYTKASKDMLHSGFTGFYLRVVQTGTLRVGETFALKAGARETPLVSLIKSSSR